MNIVGKWILLPCLLLLGGCAGVGLWGNLLVLGVTFGIFLGTLSLGRTKPDAARSRPSDDSTQSRF